MRNLTYARFAWRGSTIWEDEHRNTFTRKPIVQLSRSFILVRALRVRPTSARHFTSRT